LEGASSGVGGNVVRLVVEEITAKGIPDREFVRAIGRTVGSDELSQALSDILVSGASSLSQAEQVGGVVSTPSAELGHLLL
jgi:hypothetical protein